jgi:sigma-E factor negative regulatory protein RseC
MSRKDDPETPERGEGSPVSENRETGKVLEILEGGTAKVLVQRRKWCDHCSSKKFCNPPEEGEEFTIEVDNAVGADVGDVVEIGLARGTLLIASLWAYFIPALLFIVGISIGYLYLSRFIVVLNREILGLIAGILLLALSLAILRVVNNWLGRKKIFHPTITSICNQ